MYVQHVQQPRGTGTMCVCVSHCHTLAFSFPVAFPASQWLCSGDMTWTLGMRYFGKLPVSSSISVAVRVAAQLPAGRPIYRQGTWWIAGQTVKKGWIQLLPCYWFLPTNDTDVLFLNQLQPYWKFNIALKWWYSTDCTFMRHSNTYLKECVLTFPNRLLRAMSAYAERKAADRAADIRLNITRSLSIFGRYWSSLWQQLVLKGHTTFLDVCKWSSQLGSVMIQLQLHMSCA